MIFSCAGTTYDTERADLLLVRMLGQEYFETLYVTPERRFFGVLSTLGNGLRREFELVPYDTEANVEEAWGDDVPLDGPSVWG